MPLDFLTGSGDPISTLISIVWLGFILVFVFFGQRIMVFQTILKLERELIKLDNLAKKSKNYVLNKVPRSRKVKNSINSFMDFFAVPPISTDPYGVMRKLDLVIKQADYRFDYFVNQVAPGFSNEEKKNLKNALAGAMTTHQIAKIVRHYLELIKKYKLIQLAMLLQMQIPLIVRVAKAAEKATMAFIEGLPIGDGIGPLVTAKMMKGKIREFKDEEFVVCETSLDRKKVWVAKASGPGATTGRPGKFLKKFFKKKKITRIITIDAGMRLEGEKSGEIAEGVGVAMGGPGVERYEIEEIAVKHKIPLDAVIVKVSDEEALMPMKNEIANGIDNAIDATIAALKRASKRDKIMIIGVGNTCGVGNSSKIVADAIKTIKNYNKLHPEKKKKK